MSETWFDSAMLPQGTVTFWLTDVEQSSQAWDRAPAAMALAIRRHYEILDEIIAKHRGVRPQEQGEGDSVVAVFGSAADAIAAAIAAQAAIRAETWPDDAPLSIRIGVHTGEAELRDDANYFGQAIVRAARIRALAYGGQILLSGATASIVRPTLPDECAVIDRGTFTLTGLRDAEQVWELTYPGAPTFTGVRVEQASSAPAPIPVPLTAFVGRAEEVRELANAVRDERLVTLNGVGGCGKTRLAIEAARLLASEFASSYFVELATVYDDEAVEGAVVSQLRVPVGAGPAIDAIVRSLEGRRVLVVLDNCEQVLAAAAELATALLARLPELRLVATSREPLGVPGERGWRVASLSPDDAVELFVDRAARARSRRTDPTDQRELVSQICKRLDGIPLAIELAAARAGALPLTRLADGLDDRFRLLTGGARGAMPRQQTLQASVDWSYELLTETERIVFRRLSVFNGGFTLDAAETVVPDDTLPPPEVLPALIALVDKSLVSLGDDDRYALLETLRHYGGGKLIEAGEVAATRDRHLRWARDFLPPQLVYSDEPGWRPAAAVSAELPNLLVAAEWASEPTDRAYLNGVLLRQHLNRGNGPMIAQAAERLAEIDLETLPVDLRVLALTHQINAAVELHGAKDHRPFFQPLMTALDQNPSARPAATAYLALLFCRGYATDLDAGQRAVEATGSVLRMAHFKTMMAVTAAFLARYRETQRLIDEVQCLALDGDLDPLSPWRTNLGSAQLSVAFALGDGATVAERPHVRNHNPEFWNPRVNFFAHSETLAAGLYLGEDEVDVDLEQELQLAITAGFDLARQRDWVIPAWKFARRDPDAGAAELVAGFDVERPASFEHSSLGFTLQLGFPVAHAFLYTGDVDGAAAAVAMFRERLERYQFDPTPVPDQLEALVALHRGEFAVAEAAAFRALPLAVDTGMRPMLALTFERLAVAAGLQGATVEASRLFGAAKRVRDETQFRLVWPDERALLDDLVLDADEVAAGEALSIEDAVAYAQRARGERKRPTVGVAALTPTERQVAELAAAGKTNREIGVELLMGVETVKTHLSRVYAKLSVRGRAELSQAMASPMKN